MYNNRNYCRYKYLFKPGNRCNGTILIKWTACELYVCLLYTSFVIWLLKSAMENNIKRLYFLARDGYFMYHASLILCNTLHLPIECRYLSCSRYSLRIPMFHLDHNTALDYICRGGIDVTLTKILSRAGLTKNESEKIIKHLGLSSIKNNIIPYQKLSEDVYKRQH